MVAPEIQAVFDRHVAKYDALGNGNFGPRDAFLDPMLEVTVDRLEGDIFFRSGLFARHLNCSGVTRMLAEDLSCLGFKARRKFSFSPEGYEQNYVEVFDYETDEWVQLDATPWYRSIGTNHEEAGEHPPDLQYATDVMFIQHNAGQFLSTIRLDDGSFVDAYLAGCFMSSKQKLDLILPLAEAQRQGKDPDPVPIPEFRFHLWARQGSTFDGKTTSRADLHYDIYDLTAVPSPFIADASAALEMLVDTGAATVLVGGTAEYCMNEGYRIMGRPEKMGYRSFDGLETVRQRGDTTPGTVSWLEKHLAVLANIISRLPASRAYDGWMAKMLVNQPDDQGRIMLSDSMREIY